MKAWTPPTVFTPDRRKEWRGASPLERPWGGVFRPKILAEKKNCAMGTLNKWKRGNAGPGYFRVQRSKVQGFKTRKVVIRERFRSI